MNRIRWIFVFSIMITILFLSSAQISADELDFGTVQDMEYIFPSEISRASRGGVEFSLLSSELSMAGIAIHQGFFAAVKKGYALSIIVSYTTEEEYSSLRNVLDSVSFD